MDHQDKVFYETMYTMMMTVEGSEEKLIADRIAAHFEATFLCVIFGEIGGKICLGISLKVRDFIWTSPFGYGKTCTEAFDQFIQVWGKIVRSGDHN